MNRAEFDAFIESCYQRGFEYVNTPAGPVLLSDWHPYGSFCGCNPGIEKYIGGFRWIDTDQAVDYPTTDYTGISGVWTFLKLADVDPESAEAEALAAEQESNYLRDLGV